MKLSLEILSAMLLISVAESGTSHRVASPFGVESSERFAIPTLNWLRSCYDWQYWRITVESDWHVWRIHLNDWNQTTTDEPQLSHNHWRTPGSSLAMIVLRWNRTIINLLADVKGTVIHFSEWLDVNSDRSQALLINQSLDPAIARLIKHHVNHCSSKDVV
jgi:hypothetical protein